MEHRSDRIIIRDILVRCIVGLNPDERVKKQDVLISLVLEVDLKAAGKSDELGDTVDYKEIKKRVIALTESSSFLLVERLAHEIAALPLADPRITAGSSDPGQTRSPALRQKRRGRDCPPTRRLSRARVLMKVRMREIFIAAGSNLSRRLTFPAA